MGANPLGEAHQKLANDHGRTSPLLYRALLWTLRGAWEEAIAGVSSSAAQLQLAEKQHTRLYSVGGPDDALTWRYAEFQHAQDALTAKSLARKAGSVGFVTGRYASAPFTQASSTIDPGALVGWLNDEAWGYGLMLEHNAFLGIFELHHWSPAHGWRIYDGRVAKVDDAFTVIWTPQPEEAS